MRAFGCLALGRAEPAVAQPDERGCSDPRSTGAGFEAPAFVPGLDDLAVVGEAVEQSGGHLGIAEQVGHSPKARFNERLITPRRKKLPAVCLAYCHLLD